MKLKKVEIRNFRCFESLEVDLAPDVTILIGKNGSGKSTLINAIKYGLSFVFSKNRKINLNGQSISTSVEGLDLISYSISDANYSNVTQDRLFPISIKCDAIDRNNSPVSWELIKYNIDEQISIDEYTDAYQRLNEKKDYPVLSVYSDSFPHIESKVSKYAKQILESGNPIPRNFGYYRWDSDTASTEVWEQRFINVWKEHFYKKFAQSSTSCYMENRDIIESYLAKLGLMKNQIVDDSDENQWNELANNLPLHKLVWEINALEKEKNTIISYLKKFSEPISGITGNEVFKIDDIKVATRDRKDYVMFRFKNGEEVMLQHLPAGYRRLFSIVLDIAYRAYHLQLRHDKYPNFSPLLKNPEEVTGIVVIDEIDMHLHPSLQQEVIQRFRKTFPNIQLIVSTHSALVMSNLKHDDRNRIFKLSKRNETLFEITPIQLYGMDVSTITDIALDTVPRNVTTNKRLDYLFDLIDKDNYAKAHAELNLLKSEFGDGLPELAKAQTMLDFFEDD